MFWDVRFGSAKMKCKLHTYGKRYSSLKSKYVAWTKQTQVWGIVTVVVWDSPGHRCCDPVVQESSMSKVSMNVVVLQHNCKHVSICSSSSESTITIVLRLSATCSPLWAEVAELDGTWKAAPLIGECDYAWVKHLFSELHSHVQYWTFFADDQWPVGVAVSTTDSDSVDGGSIPSRAFLSQTTDIELPKMTITLFYSYQEVEASTSSHISWGQKERFFGLR